MKAIHLIISTFFILINGLTENEIFSLRNQIKDAFYHSYDNYLKYAFPHDELKPISASYTDSLGELGNSKSSNKEYKGIALSAIESLSTIAIFNNVTEFNSKICYIIQYISFDIDLRINIFEVNIRIVGGLLSAHILLSDPLLPFGKEYECKDEEYNNELLTITNDLVERLMPAFGDMLPYGWVSFSYSFFSLKQVNLKYGLSKSETSSTCTAAIGTTLLEFGMLSYLTNNFRYFNASLNALSRLYEHRSSLGLLGNTINIKDGKWLDETSDIGAGIDSLYEYVFKSYILFGKKEFLELFSELYSNINKFMLKNNWYIPVNMNTGNVQYYQFNALQAYFPGLQALFGDLESAKRTHSLYFSLFQHCRLLPERYSLDHHRVHATEKYYLLRPEIAESTYLLYRATKDDKYLQMGKLIFESLMKYCYHSNGFVSIKNIETMEMEDRMPSFFLSETFKYLYLLFDHSNWFNINEEKILFTTEGHVFPILNDVHKKYSNINIEIDHLKEISLNPTSTLCEVHHYNISSSYSINSKRIVFADKITPKQQQCPAKFPKAPIYKSSQFNINFANNLIHLSHKSNNETFIIHFVNNSLIEFIDSVPSKNLLRMGILVNTRFVEHFLSLSEPCNIQLPIAPSSYGPSLDTSSISSSTFSIESEHSYGCSIDKTYDMKEFIVLDRGECTFISKTFNVQNSDGSVVLIINHKDEDSENLPIFIMGASDKDGSRYDISIPSFLLSFFDGQKLHSCYKENPKMFGSISSTISSLSSTLPVFSNRWVNGTLDLIQVNAFANWSVLLKKTKNNMYHIELPE